MKKLIMKIKELPLYFSKETNKIQKHGPMAVLDPKINFSGSDYFLCREIIDHKINNSSFQQEDSNESTNSTNL